MGPVDSHCHLQDAAFDADRNVVLARALETVAWLVVVGDDVASSRQAQAMTRDRVFATAGIHPHEADQADDAALAEIRALCGEPRVVAVGEIGLDYHYDNSPRDVQRNAFTRQLDLACDVALPVVVHTRDAQADTCALIEPVVPRLAGGVMHCFSGDAAFAERCLAWGFYISFAGNVTFPKAEPLRDAARVVPLDRLLVETDCPYLAPQPVRGKRCEPAQMHHTVEVLAALKGVPTDVLAQCTADNAGRLFGGTIG